MLDAPQPGSARQPISAAGVMLMLLGTACIGSALFDLFRPYCEHGCGIDARLFAAMGWVSGVFFFIAGTALLVKGRQMRVPAPEERAEFVRRVRASEEEDARETGRGVPLTRYRCPRCKRWLRIVRSDRESASIAGRGVAYIITFVVVVAVALSEIASPVGLALLAAAVHAIVLWLAYRRHLKHARFYCASCDKVFRGEFIRDASRAPQLTTIAADDPPGAAREPGP